MPFSEVIAQDRAIHALRAALGRGALHHAYLFGGPQGTGKATAARLLAQAANCQGDPPHEGAYRDEPCGKCRSCRNIEAQNHPDVLFIRQERAMAKAGTWEPKSGRSPSKDIVVDQIRDLVDHRLSMKRFEGRRRFVIIDPAEAMNPQAQNALLKTLEEPPQDTTLVLSAASPDALLPTIRSRCLRVAFRPVPFELITSRLEKEGRSPEESRIAAALCGGSVGRALALGKEELDLLKQAVKEAVALGPQDVLAWLSYARAHGENREAAAELCQLLGVFLRDVLARQAGGERPVLVDLEGETRKMAEGLSPHQVIRRHELAKEAVRALEGNASAVLALEGMFVGWFHGL